MKKRLARQRHQQNKQERRLLRAADRVQRILANERMVTRFLQILQTRFQDSTRMAE